MRTRLWIASLVVGSFVVIGGMTAKPMFGQAQETAATPGATASEQNNATPVVGTPLFEPAVDLVRAQEIALNGQSGAVVTEVDLDGSDGVLAYDVRLDNGTEVQVDATTGAVIQTEQAGSADQNGDNGEGDNGDGDTEDGNQGENDNSNEQSGDNEEHQGDNGGADNQDDGGKGDNQGDNGNGNDQGDNENDEEQG